MPVVHFFVPSPSLVADLPRSIEDYWAWADPAIRRSPAPLGNGRGDCTWAGPYNWTLQTYVYLRQAGLASVLTALLPDEGIIVTHGDFLPAHLRPSARQFVVEIKPDRPLQCIHANFVIVQNRRDPIRRGLHRVLVPSAYVNYWPQPGLLPRDAGRQERFENARFVGNPEQFLPDAERLSAELARLGMTWQIVPRDRWHDYRDTDVVVAVRPRAFTNARAEYEAYFAPNRKPASKLYNAWLAGVPAVLSPDVAFRDLRRSSLDYLEAESVSEIVDRLRELQADAALRQAVAENGRQRAREFSAEHTVLAWTGIIEQQILPRYAAWQESPLRRRWFFLSRPLLRAKAGTPS